MVSPTFQDAYNRFKKENSIKSGDDFRKVENKFAVWQKRKYGLSYGQTKALADATKEDGIKPVKDKPIIYKGKDGIDVLRIVHIDPSTGRFVKADGSYTPRSKKK